MADEYKYDVFISYSHKDEDWVVNTLLPAIEDTGLKACIDFRDFIPGKPSRKNMSEAVQQSAYTVLVMTPAWMASEWTAFEALLAFLDDPSGKRQRTVPLYFEACEIPKDIQIFTYIDFTREDRQEIAWTQLFTALGKPDAPIPGTPKPEESEFEIPKSWFLAHPYPMPPNFTGREAERKMLTGWLENDDENRLFILNALGGFGKSALSWYWLTHNVGAKQWPKVVWWSFYEGDASFEHFIKETLEYLNVEVPPGQRGQVDTLLKAMGEQNILLIMDGFERALRAYSSMTAAYQGDEESPSPGRRGARGEVEISQRDCVNINAEIFLKNLCVLPNIKGKVLMATRLTPRAVEGRGELLDGCYEEELQAMQKEDAVAFFRAQGIRGARAEIEAACAPYGYHPLSLRILAGLIANDREAPGDIAVAGKLDITKDVVANKHHVLEVAYDTLSPEQQKLLSHIACFRSAMNYDAINAISDENIDDDLKTLEHRGLLHWDKTANKYDLHPIVRRYAYERLTTPDRAGAHERLVNYFEAVSTPQRVEKLEDLAPVIELYHHMVRAGNLDDACDLYSDRMYKPIYFQFGSYQTEIELLSALFLDGEDKPPRLKKEGAQGWTLNSLANSYSLSGQPRRAIPLYETVNAILEKADDKKNLATELGNVADDQLKIGALNVAERNLRHRIDLGKELDDDWNIDNGYRELARVLAIRGMFSESDNAIEIALEHAKKTNHVQNQGTAYTYRALRFLLLAGEQLTVGSRQLADKSVKSAIECAQRALEFSVEWQKITRRANPNPRDYTRGLWLLGAAYRANNELTLAEENLSKALNLCRQINAVDAEADILLDFARLRYAQEKPEEAKTLAEEALTITERSGYVLQGADVHLFLAQYALEQEKDKEKARELAQKAKELAYCDGPPYTYKVAYEEAERMLEKLKN